MASNPLAQRIRAVTDYRVWHLSLAAVVGFAIVGAALTAIPIVRPGGYKAVTLASLVVNLAIPLYWLSRHNRRPASTWAGLPRFLVLQAAFFTGLFTLAWMTTAGCEVPKGITTALLLTLPGSFMAYGVAEVAQAWGRRPKLLFFGVWLVLALFAGAWFLWQPTYQLTAPLVGMLLGPPNEAQSVTVSRVYWYALERVVAGLALCVTAEAIRLGAGKIWRGWLAAGLLLWIGWGTLLASSSDLDYRITRDRLINDELSDDWDSTGIKHYVSRSIPTDGRPWLVLEAEFQRERQKSLLGLDDTTIPHSTIYWYDKQKEKQRLTGAKRTKFAKVHLQEFYVSFDAFPPRAVGHEMAHITSGRYSDNPMRVPGRLGGIWYNPALVEGFAVAVAWDDFPLSAHEQASIALRKKRLPSLEDLFSPVGFATTNLSVAYKASGSFFRFCMDTYGVDKVTTWFGTEDFQAAFGMPMAEAEQAWRTMLAGITPPAADVGRINDIQGRPAISKEKCGRSEADKALSRAVRNNADTEVQQCLAALEIGADRKALATIAFERTKYKAKRARYKITPPPMPEGLSEPDQQRYQKLVAMTHWAWGNRAAAEEAFGNLADGIRTTESTVIARVMLRDGMSYDQYAVPEGYHRLLVNQVYWQVDHKTRHDIMGYRLARTLWSQQRWAQLVAVTDALDLRQVDFPDGETGTVLMATRQMRGLAAFATRDFERAETLWQDYLEVVNSQGRRNYGETWLARSRYFGAHKDRLTADLPRR